jgi:addiction module HigA family antidote
MNDQLASVHPGEVLLEDFLKANAITQARLAKETGIPESRISAIINGERSVSADTALRFAQFFGTSAQVWLNLQNQYDLEVTQRAIADQLTKIRLAFAQNTPSKKPVLKPRR